MAGDIQISQTFTAPFTIGLDWLFGTPAGDPQDHRLANAVIIALNTDRRALPDDKLPDPHSTDRRGWWGDTDAGAVWGATAPIGSRLWLLSRVKLPGAVKDGLTIERARRYIAEALQPLVDVKVASKFTVDLAHDAPDRISGLITIYRGPKTAIALAFQDFWRDFGG